MRKAGQDVGARDNRYVLDGIAADPGPLIRKFRYKKFESRLRRIRFNRGIGLPTCLVGGSYLVPW